VPVLNNIKPLIPKLALPPESCVRKAIDPDDIPAPLTTLTDPPVFPDLPAEKIKSPPTPLSPDPTVIDIEPPLPDAAIPEPILILPLFPFEDVPLLKITAPLTPVVVYESADIKSNEPEEVKVFPRQ
jgi:hypothetical protein